MTFITRRQEFDEVRRRLDFPLFQKPNSDLIVSELIATEQSMANRLGSQVSKGWTKKSTSITTVSGTAEYTVTPAAGSKVGRVLYAFRDLGSNVLLPIDFVDSGVQLTDQKHSFWTAPIVAGSTGGINTGYRLGFWRDGATQKVRIHPIPEEAITIVIVYAAGQLDFSTWDWADSPALPEWSFLRVHYTARNLVGRCEWEGMPLPDNASKQVRLYAELQGRINEEEPRFEAYIRNPSGETISDLGDWYDD